jgi:hypothetical protein
MGRGVQKTEKRVMGRRVQETEKRVMGRRVQKTEKRVMGRRVQKTEKRVMGRRVQRERGLDQQVLPLPHTTPQLKGPEPEFVILFRSRGIDSQHFGPVLQPTLSIN